MAGYKMSPFELYWKIGIEGGVLDAVFGYGIDVSDISTKTPQGQELANALDAMRQAYFEHFAVAFQEFDRLLEEYQSVGQEEYDEDDE